MLATSAVVDSAAPILVSPYRASVSTSADVSTRPHARTPSTRWDAVRLGLVGVWIVVLVAALTAPAPADGGTLVSTVWGREVSGWLGWLTLVATVAVLALVVVGPPPWRGTRWAWFWLVGNPFGLLAFLLLAGPTPGVPDGQRSRRLTGGPAFVIGLAATAVLRAARVI
jgi:hypothetical protein